MRNPQLFEWNIDGSKLVRAQLPIEFPLGERVIVHVRSSARFAHISGLFFIVQGVVVDDCDAANIILGHLTKRTFRNPNIGLVG